MTFADWIVLFTGVAALAGLYWFFFGPKQGQAAAIRGGVQEVTIRVEGAYHPNVITVKAGMPVRLKFDRREGTDCSNRVVLPDFGISRALAAFATTTVEFTPEQPGEYPFACAMNMYRGTIVAEPAEGEAPVQTAESPAAQVRPEVAPRPSPDEKPAYAEFLIRGMYSLTTVNAIQDLLERQPAWSASRSMRIPSGPRWITSPASSPPNSLPPPLKKPVIALPHLKSNFRTVVASRVTLPTLAQRPSGGKTVRPSMSFQARRELLARVASRYREASPRQKTQILDEFVASTGYAQKYAIHLLTHPPSTPPQPIRRPRTHTYGLEVQQALWLTWAAANFICGKRLVPFLPELVRRWSGTGICPSPTMHGPNSSVSARPRWTASSDPCGRAPGHGVLHHQSRAAAQASGAGTDLRRPDCSSRPDSGRGPARRELGFAGSRDEDEEDWLLAEFRPGPDWKRSLQEIREELGHLARQHGTHFSERHVMTEEGELLRVELRTSSRSLFADWWGRHPAPKQQRPRPR